jgi:hypothetical protein
MNTVNETRPGSALAMVHDALSQAVALGRPALAAPRVESMEQFDEMLRKLDGLCRETFQETLRDGYEVIARKLDRGTPLSVSERQALALLFTGEAAYYLKTENNYHDWIDELNRLVGELSRIGAEGIGSLADLMHVQALCRDAMHVTPEVTYYLREKQRIAQFRESVSGAISPEGGRLLARMIRDLMASPYR